MNTNQEINTKICSCCNAEKELTEFHKDKGGKYGVKKRCKICTLEYNINYYKSEEIKIRKKKYNKLEKVKAKRKEL